MSPEPCKTCRLLASHGPSSPTEDFEIVKNLGFEGLGLRVEGLGFRVEGLGFRVEGLGFRVEG